TTAAEKGEADAVEAFKLADRSRGFDLHSGSQVRLTVLDLGDNINEFVWGHHHILMDGWCVGILIKEFFQLYEGYLSGKPAALTTVYPYSDYMKWLMALDQTASLSYWGNYLLDYNQTASFPKKNNYKTQDYNLCKTNIELSKEVRASITDLCISLGITENTFIQVIWGILLSRYNNSKDVVFGAVVSGRPGEIAGIEEMIGLFVNTIPVRIQFSGKETIAELLKTLQKKFAEGSQYHYTQLANIQLENNKDRELFDHILAFENYPVQELIVKESGTNKKENLSILSSEGFEQNGYDLTLFIFPHETLTFSFFYNDYVYSVSTIEKLQAQLMQTIEQALAHPGLSLDKLVQLSFTDNYTALPSVSSVVDPSVPVLCSEHQNRMWFIDEFEKDYLYQGSPVYHNLP
ncbi:condensation domain-containing protein, partial [Pedobacter sp. UYP1]|uniref:condensation domain-containing protein n=1 Tax=Pedobacter sp. UYP1 TaxID=1756396 RepID=UPI003391C9AB